MKIHKISVLLAAFALILSAQSTVSQTHAGDKTALLSWTPAVLVMTDWRQRTDPCNDRWSGITCAQVEGALRVTEIRLNNRKLLGTISPNLGNLQALTALDLSQNSLNGAIPSRLGLLPFLRILNLSVNQLVGQIPPELGGLQMLESMVLSTNFLTGQIPPEIGTLSNLQTLFLFENKLTGTIPDSISNQMTRLKLIDISRNQLTGTMPAFLGSPSLQSINLKDNGLTGQIPDSFYNLPALGFIDISANMISGTIPPNTGYIRQLGYLYASNNLIEGSIPEEFGNLRNLGFLSLAYNKLDGSIPENIANCPFASLDLSFNRLSGNIPEAVNAIAQRATTNVDCNALTGTSIMFKQGTCNQCAPGFIPQGNFRQCKASFTMTPQVKTNGTGVVQSPRVSRSKAANSQPIRATRTFAPSPSSFQETVNPPTESSAPQKVDSKKVTFALRGTIESFDEKTFATSLQAAIKNPNLVMKVTGIRSGSVITDAEISSADPKAISAEALTNDIVNRVAKADPAMSSLGIISIQKAGSSSATTWGQDVTTQDNQAEGSNENDGDDSNDLAIPLGVGIGVGVGSLLVAAGGYAVYRRSKRQQQQQQATSAPYPTHFTTAPVLEMDSVPIQPIAYANRHEAPLQTTPQTNQSVTVEIRQAPIQRSELASLSPADVRAWLLSVQVSSGVVDALYQDGVTGARLLNATHPLLLRAFGERDANVIWSALCALSD